MVLTNECVTTCFYCNLNIKAKIHDIPNLEKLEIGLPWLCSIEGCHPLGSTCVKLFLDKKYKLVDKNNEIII